MKKPSENVKPLVYLDTNALNFLCDQFKGKSKRSLKYFEIPLSWPLLDEIECNSSYARVVELAEFVWQVSNKRVFVLASDLVALELRAAFSNRTTPLDSYYESGDSHLRALNEARKGKTPRQKRTILREPIAKQKLYIQNKERAQRKKWAPHFGNGGPFPNDWRQFAGLLHTERCFNQVLWGMVVSYGLSGHFTHQDVMNLDYGILPSLSIWLEFYVALQFLLDSQPKSLGKPDRGDLPDLQHAFYVGLCDYFITDDPRVKHILLNLIKPKSTKVMGHDAFLTMLLSK